MKRCELLKHEADCVCRIVLCPDSMCEERISLSNLSFHIKTKNKTPISVLDAPLVGFKIDLTDTVSVAHLPLLLWEQDQTEFYPQLISKGGFWYFWVKVKGGLETKFSVEVFCQD